MSVRFDSRANSVPEASSVLVERGGDAKLLAGGQSLMPMVNLGLAQPEVLIDISFIPNLDGIALEDSSLRIGALTRYRAIGNDWRVRERQPLLIEALRHVGNPRVRNIGTLGGSLAHNDPAAELPLVMQVVEADIVLSNGAKTRTVSAADFLTYFTTALRDDELLVSVHVPRLEEGWGWGFHEFSTRAGDFAIVAAAAVAHCRNGVIEGLRVGLAGAGDRAVRAHRFEQSAQGIRVDGVDEIAETALEDISPVTDALASAGYRRHLARVLVGRAVRDACCRSQGDMA